MDADSVTFTFVLADPPHAQLVVRCAPNGEVYASLPERDQRSSSPFAAGD